MALTNTELKSFKLKAHSSPEYEYSSKPIYYIDPLSKKEYLITLQETRKHKGKIVKYDIADDEYITLAKINHKKFQPPIGYFIHQKQDKLYLFHTGTPKSNNRHVFICNLQSGECRVIKNALKVSDEFERIEHAELHYIEDDVHFIYGKALGANHEIFDTSNTTLVDLENNADDLKIRSNNAECPQAVYVKELEKFIAVGIGRNKPNQIWSLNTKNNNRGKVYEARWKRCRDIKLPKLSSYSAPPMVLGFGCVIYLFCWNDTNKQIWCLDLSNKKWYLSAKSVPSFIESDLCLISTGGQYCHYYQSGSIKVHYKLDLFDASPDELKKRIIERIQLKSKNVTFDYITKYERKYGLNCPDYLKRIVCLYHANLPQ